MENFKGFWARTFAKLFIFAFVVVATGVIGYLYQAQFFRAVSPTRHRMRHFETLSKAEFHERTKRGWYWGCAGGAVLGALLVFRLSMEKE